MKKIKIEWLAKKSNLSQIYSSGLEYCFVSDDNKQVCSFVLCKDYLQDALLATHNDKQARVYGFGYDPKKDLPLCMTQTRLALANSSDNDFMDKIPHLLDFLNQIERKLHLLRTVVYQVKNPPKKYEKCSVILLHGSNRWMLSPPMISLYTLLIRVGFRHTKDKPFEETIKGVAGGKIAPYQTNDAHYLKSAEQGIDLILKHGYARIFYKEPKRNFPNIDVNTMHNNFGIVGFAAGSTKGHVKYWHRNLNKRKNTEKETVQ